MDWLGVCGSALSTGICLNVLPAAVCQIQLAYFTAFVGHAQSDAEKQALVCRVMDENRYLHCIYQDECKQRITKCLELETWHIDHLQHGNSASLIGLEVPNGYVELCGVYLPDRCPYLQMHAAHTHSANAVYGSPRMISRPRFGLCASHYHHQLFQQQSFCFPEGMSFLQQRFTCTLTWDLVPY